MVWGLLCRYVAFVNGDHSASLSAAGIQSVCTAMQRKPTRMMMMMMINDGAGET